MKTKKIMAVAVASTMMLSLVGCGGSEAFKKNSDALIDAAKEHGAEKLAGGKDITDYDNGGYDTSTKSDDMAAVNTILSDVKRIDTEDIKIATLFMDYKDSNNYIQGVVCDFSSADIAEDFFNDAVDTIEDMIEGTDAFVTDLDDTAYYIGFDYAGMEIYYTIAYEDTALTYVQMIGTDSSFTNDAKEFMSDFSDKGGYKDPTDLV